MTLPLLGDTVPGMWSSVEVREISRYLDVSSPESFFSLRVVGRFVLGEVPPSRRGGPPLATLFEHGAPPPSELSRLSWLGAPSFSWRILAHVCASAVELSSLLSRLERCDRGELWSLRLLLSGDAAPPLLGPDDLPLLLSEPDPEVRAVAGKLFCDGLPLPAALSAARVLLLP